MPSGSPDNEEIQRFEDQYRRNPDSLVFARLADACRKAGDPERALQLLHDGIGKHPDYPTAHLVRARTLIDLGRPADAEESLRRVLELDGQNLVAMRDIAVLAEERGDPRESVGWYEQIATLDPGNPEAAEALDRLRGAVPTTPRGLDPLPAPREEWWSSPNFEIGDETPGAETPGDEAARAEKSPADAGLDAEHEPLAEAEPEPEATIELTEDDLRPSWSDPALPVETDATAELDALAAELDAGMEADRVLEGPDEAEPPEEPDAPEVVGTGEEPDRSEALDPPATSEPPDVSERDAGRKAAWWFEDPADAESEDEREDGDLLTRTMADLYVKQGLLEDAAGIYRELLADRPDDAELRRALRDVEQTLAGPGTADAGGPPEAADPGAAITSPATESLGPAGHWTEESVPEHDPAEEASAQAASTADAPEEDSLEEDSPEEDSPQEDSREDAPPAAGDPYASHPVPPTAGTSQFFRDWLRRLSG